MVPLAHATSEGSDEPAHLHSLARGIVLPVHEIMVPLAHATSEGFDEPAHLHSLARGINAHIQGM